MEKLDRKSLINLRWSTEAGQRYEFFDFWLSLGKVGMDMAVFLLSKTPSYYIQMLLSHLIPLQPVHTINPWKRIADHIFSLCLQMPVFLESGFHYKADFFNTLYKNMSKYPKLTFSHGWITSKWIECSFNLLLFQYQSISVLIGNYRVFYSKVHYFDCIQKG